MPALTAEQMREVDRVMVEDLHITLVQMMENAGRSLAEVAVRRFHPETVTVLAGPGGNGGGGLVAARHLANRGVTVEVSLAGAARDLRPVPAHQLDILVRTGISVTDQPRPAALVIDALLGYSLRGDPTGRAGELIDWANRSGCAILSLDIPSGLDADTAVAASPCITADATVTLALPKVGLRNAGQVGQLYLADISVPSRAYHGLGVSVPALFRDSPLIELEYGDGVFRTA
ncbi:MAG: NAD(P)H-hydrate epimerase [Actinomycetota bacterium]|nr:NAD(P)H-hydrate epimerase [Actinomycetota bacterium]